MSAQDNVWVFGYGSLIWGTGFVKVVDRQEGVLSGWHREWNWISGRARPGAPTCSLDEGGAVKGIFLRLNPATVKQDLEAFRERERRSTEQVIRNVPVPGAETHFWTMGNNLADFPNLRGLSGQPLYKALADKARPLTTPGGDGVLPADYIRRVHAFDPADTITASIVHYL